MMHRPWSSIVEVPYCFSRSNVKFQGHTALKIVKFYRNWAFLDSNSSLNSLMVMKCCTKLETAKERCPIVFQSHPSNFKVTQDKTSPLLTRIGRFRTIGRSQLSNPSDLPCYNLGENVELRFPFFIIWGKLWWCRIYPPPQTWSAPTIPHPHPLGCHYHSDGLLQDCSISSALALETLQSCTKPPNLRIKIGFGNGLVPSDKPLLESVLTKSFSCTTWSNHGPMSEENLGEY